MSTEVVLSKGRTDAVLFDMDGVITRTADVHASAWKRMFDEYLKARADRDGRPFEPFDVDADYRRYVDGKPRYDGVASFLKARGISLPYGDPADPPDAETVCGLGNRKALRFQEHLAEHGAEVYQTTVSLIRRLRALGVKTAVFSASKNADAVLRAADVIHLFDVKVDGVDAEQLGLAGKPDPAVLLEAARRLGVSPDRSVVVEDAIAGVEAGRAGRFALVIGVNRSGETGVLVRHGADVEVADLSEVTIAEGDTMSTASTHELPSAFDRLDDIRRRMAGRCVAVFLDYDGTLTPIVEDPDAAALSGRMRTILRRLAEQSTVAIVSGRDLQDVRRFVDLDRIYYAGSHGFELAGPQGWHKEHEAGSEFLPALDEAERELREPLKAVPGARLERKRFAIAVHYRQVRDADVGAVEEIVDRARTEHPRLRKTAGKKVFELRPNLDWDKGKALFWLLQALGLDPQGTLLLYIGDDVTDEDAFQALAGSGIAIVVTDGGRRPTSAHLALSDPEEVGRFLELLSSQLQERPPPGSAQTEPEALSATLNGGQVPD